MKLKIFFCQFPNPWTLRVSGMGGYTSKCEKSQNHCTLSMHADQGGLLGVIPLSLQLPISRSWCLLSITSLKALGCAKRNGTAYEASTTKRVLACYQAGQATRCARPNVSVCLSVALTLHREVQKRGGPEFRR